MTVIFRGRVQGVFFRATTRALAQDYAVTGWGRNEADGSVRCVVEGDPG
ncbi:MAG: acylphosphatase, partial [Phycisphaerales bacterium]|nr:acylphosphatase [Phycisphaerales bacterium]